MKTNSEVGASNLNCFNHITGRKLVRTDIKKLSVSYKCLLFILIPNINVTTRKVIYPYCNLKKILADMHERTALET